MFLLCLLLHVVRLKGYKEEYEYALYSTKIELFLKINVFHCIICDIKLMSKKKPLVSYK